MQMTYDGAYSVEFGEHPVILPNGKYSNAVRKHSWRDWHLVPTSRPVIQPPPVKKNTIEIIGANSLIDLTDIPRGFPTYQNRTGSLEFYVDHSIPWKKGDNDVEYRWSAAYDEIKEYLHGQRMNMYLSGDPEYYYTGRFTVDSWKSGNTISTITIGYDLDPYKLKNYSTLEEWEWDPFIFDDEHYIPNTNRGNYIRDLSEQNYVVYSADDVGTMPVSPKFYLDDNTTHVYAQVYTSFKGYWGDIVRIDRVLSGFEDLRLILSTPRKNDVVQINFYSDENGTPATSGTVSIDFRQGRL